MNDANESVMWVRELAVGNEQVMLEFWQAYASRLERLAKSRMVPTLQRRVGPEDIAQSVCRTFLRRAQEGEFTVEASEGLWRLLCAITLTKVRQHARFHYRKKRGLNREVELDDCGSGCDGDRFEPPDRLQVSPEEALAFADQMSHLMGKLDDEERRIVEGKLEGLTHGEVAARLHCSERTVRRLLERVHGRWSRELNDSLRSE